MPREEGASRREERGLERRGLGGGGEGDCPRAREWEREAQAGAGREGGGPGVQEGARLHGCRAVAFAGGGGAPVTRRARLRRVAGPRGPRDANWGGKQVRGGSRSRRGGGGALLLNDRAFFVWRSDRPLVCGSETISAVDAGAGLVLLVGGTRHAARRSFFRVSTRQRRPGSATRRGRPCACPPDPPVKERLVYDFPCYLVVNREACFLVVSICIILIVV